MIDAERQKNKIYRVYQEHYQDKKAPQDIREFFDYLMEKELFYENELSKWDMIENYMYSAEVVTENSSITLYNCINILTGALEVTSKEIRNMLSRACIEGRLEVSFDDQGLTDSFPKDPSKKVFAIVRFLQCDCRQNKHDDFLNRTYVKYQNDMREPNSVSAYYTRNMLYMLKEEKAIRETTNEKLVFMEKQLENLYGKFLELAGILIAIFSVIGFNLLSLKESMDISYVIVVNCMIVFALTVLCLLIELLFMRRGIDKKVIIVFGVSIISFITAILILSGKEIASLIKNSIELYNSLILKISGGGY